MTIAAQIKSVSSNLEISTKAAEFGAVARVFMASRGDGKLAAEMARAQGLGARVADVVMKTPVAAMSMTSATALSEYGDVIAAFLGSLSSAGAFDAMLPNMRKVNPHVRLVSITASATAYIAGEGGARPLTSLALEGHQLAEYEAAAILVESAELLRGASPDTARWFRDDLTRATALVTDQKFISLVTSGLTAITSAGATSNQILQDITRLLAAINTDASSKVYVLLQPATMKAMATKTTASTGTLAFPTLTINGGTLAGVTFVPSDAVSNGTMVGIDANAVAASAGDLGLEVLRQADVQFETAPDSPMLTTTILQNLWQNNLAALLVRRKFGAKLLRSTGAAMIDSVNYQTGNSPA